MRAPKPRRRIGPFATAALVLFVTSVVILTGPARAESFRRGINISYLFTFPKASGWPPFRGRRSAVEDSELARLKTLGFDFVRLPVDPQPFLAASAEQRQELFAALGRFLERVGAAGLGIIVVGYTTDDSVLSGMEVNASTEGTRTFARYVSWLDEIASVLDSTAGLNDVAIEILNEPASPCDAQAEQIWSERQAATARRLRAQHPRIRMVVTGGCWSGIDGLLRLRDIPDDPTTLFDVHYYEPFSFTHQGATWSTPILPYVGGLQFPPAETDRTEAYAEVDRLVGAKTLGTSRGRKLRREARSEVDAYLDTGKSEAQIRANFEKLARWADCRKIQRSQLLLGEFGAIEGLPGDAAHSASRARWIAATRGAAEEFGMGWAMWSYFKPLGLLEDDRSRTISPSLVRALGLGSAVASTSGAMSAEAKNAC